MVPETGKGSEQPKAGGLVGKHLEGGLIETGIKSLFGAARDQADGLQGVGARRSGSRSTYFNVVGTWTPGAHSYPRTKSHQTVIGGAHRDSQFGSRVDQFARNPVSPGLLWEPAANDLE